MHWYYKKARLEDEGAKQPMYAFHLRHFCMLTTASNTGWHGKSSRVRSGGHITVEFWMNTGSLLHHQSHVLKEQGLYSKYLKLYAKIIIGDEIL